MIISSYPPCQHVKQEAPPLGSNLVSCTRAYIAWPKYRYHVCMCPITRWALLQEHSSISALKTDISSIVCGMTRTLSNIMYDFINSGIIGKPSSHNFILRRLKDTSISLCVWSTNLKDTNTSSLKMPFATNNDHYAKTYLFLLSLAQLSDWTRIVGKFMAITGSLGGSGNECRQSQHNFI